MKVIAVSLLAVMACAPAHAGDGFGKVRCNGDVARALIGQRGSNEPVMAIEARRRDLNLRDLGASDFGAFSAITWAICGEEFVVLEDNRTNVIRDALQFRPIRRTSRRSRDAAR